MAHEEMVSIRELDTSLLEEHGSRIYLYFAQQDGWVSTHRATIVRVVMADDAGRVVEGQPDVPHAFCISEFASSMGIRLLNPHHQTTARRSPTSAHCGLALSVCE
jgi:hypothetical protein